DDFGDRFIQPAVAALANKIDYNGLQLYKQISNSVSTIDAGVAPPIATPTQLLVYLMAGVMLDNHAAPQDEQRYLVITPEMQAYIVDAWKGLVQQSTAIAQQYAKGTMGTAAGFTWAMDQNCPTVVNGGYAGAGTVITSGTQTGNQLLTGTWTSGQLSLKGGEV